MLKTAAAASIALFLMATPAAHGNEWGNPPSAPVGVEIVTVNGSGCPAGTVWATVNDDNSGFVVRYRSFRAEVGAGSSPTDIRKNCQLNLRLDVPGDYTYAVGRVEYRGFASLQRGATALQKANYYFSGSSANNSVSHPFAGPYHGRWETVDAPDSSAWVYKPCGQDRNFNINAELRVDGGSSDANGATNFITMQATEGDLDSSYRFAWRRC